MAVPKYKRSVSAKEYWHTFKKIRTDIRTLLLEDFKVKTEMEDNMKGYPIWILQHQGGRILNSLSVISACINRAEAIHYPTNDNDYNRMIKLQNRALEECFVLYEEMTDCSELFPVKQKCYTIIGHMIKDEILYLKYWRKYIKRQMDLLYDELFIKPFLTGEYLEHHQITETEILMSKMQLI
jgi:hypothetical protein